MTVPLLDHYGYCYAIANPLLREQVLEEAAKAGISGDDVRAASTACAAEQTILAARAALIEHYGRLHAWTRGPDTSEALAEAAALGIAREDVERMSDALQAEQARLGSYIADALAGYNDEVD